MKIVPVKSQRLGKVGHFFSFDGNFVGMNLFLTTRRAFFVPWNIIFEHLKQKITLAQLKCLKFYRYF